MRSSGKKQDGRRRRDSKNHEQQRKEYGNREQKLHEVEEDRCDRKNHAWKRHALDQRSSSDDRPGRHHRGARKERPVQQTQQQIEYEAFGPHLHDVAERDCVSDHHQKRIGERPEEAEHRASILQLHIAEDKVSEELSVAHQSEQSGADARGRGAIFHFVRPCLCFTSDLCQSDQADSGPPTKCRQRKEHGIDSKRNAGDPLEPVGQPHQQRACGSAAQNTREQPRKPPAALPICVGTKGQERCNLRYGNERQCAERRREERGKLSGVETQGKCRKVAADRQGSIDRKCHQPRSGLFD